METPIEANISITPLANKRTAFCEQQAAECALAATTAILPEIREAYLNIERSWLHLAPEIDSSRSFLSASKAPAELAPAPDESKEETAPVLLNDQSLQMNRATGSYA
jgi:hypothetical protein